MNFIDWLIVISISGIACIITYFLLRPLLNCYRFYIKGDRETKRFLGKALLIYLAALFVTHTASFIMQQALHNVSDITSQLAVISFLSSAVVSPASLLQDSIPIFIVVWFLWRLKPLGAHETRNFDADGLGSVSIEDAVSRIFRSSDFLNAINTSLPRGEKDEEYGLDYIPFMLDSLQHKRRRFDKRANIFFWVTISVGMIFACIITVLGYTLVNERAVGLPKDVAVLREEAEKLNGVLKMVDTDLIENYPVQARVEAFDDQLYYLTLNDKNKALARSLVQTLKHLKGLRHIDEMHNAVATAKSGIDATDNGAKKLSDQLAEFDAAVDSVQNEAKSLLPNLLAQSRQLDTALKKVELFDDKDQNRLAELLKRLSIGVVIATFFFGILRYVAGQFRANWQEAVRAEDEDLWIRRFYVSLKSAGASNSDRSAAIASLLKGMPASPQADDKKDDDFGKMNIDLLKELLGAISKKL